MNSLLLKGEQIDKEFSLWLAVHLPKSAICVCNHIAVMYLVTVMKEGQNFGNFDLNFCCFSDKRGAMSL